MDVSLLYFDGCPNHHATLTLLEALLNESRWGGTIQLVNVDSPERAEELGFRGSPTVLIDGGAFPPQGCQRHIGDPHRRGGDGHDCR